MNKKGKCLLLLSFLFLFAGCSKQVITVAGIESEEQTNYIEISEFELKEPKAEYEGKEVMFCAVLIPDKYRESEEIPGMYIHERYPVEASNIYYSVSAGTVSDALTDRLYEKLVEEAYAEAGTKVDLEITSFERTSMEEVPVYKICSSYAKESKQVQQLTYLILAEEIHTVTYTQLSDDEMMEDYTAAEGQIKLITTEK